MENLTEEQKNKRVKILVPLEKPMVVSVQEIDDRVADLTQHQSNLQKEIDNLLVQRRLAEKEVKK